MRSFKLLPAAILLASAALTSCESTCEPAPQCVSGRVVGNTCMDGLLIEVDAQYQIGDVATLPRGGQPDTLLGFNVIAVVNSNELRSATPAIGQRLSFSYVNDPDRQWNMLCCFANDGVQTQIPRLVLSNISTTPCGETRSND